MTERNHVPQIFDLTDAPVREELFRKIFEQYYRSVHALFARWGFDNTESEDLVQEVFFRVYQSLPSFRGDSKLSTWVYQIAGNVYKNNLRSEGAQKRRAENISLDEVKPKDLLIETLEAPGLSPLEQVLQDEQRATLAYAAQSLPTRMRECLELRIFHDKKYNEIAIILGISLQTVRSLLFEARRILKSKLGIYFEPLLAGEEPERATAPPVISHNVTADQESLAGVYLSAELIEAFLAEEHCRSRHTTAAYRRHLQGFLSFFRGAPITHSGLTGYCTSLLSDGRGAASHRQALAAVRGFLEWFSTVKGRAASFPTALEIQQILRVPSLRQQQNCASPVSNEEVEDLLRYAPAVRDRVMLSLFLGGGLKVNELVRLRVEDFNQRGSALFVTVKGRTVPLPPEVRELISCYLEETERTWESFGVLLLHLPRRGGRPSPEGILTNRAVEYRLQQLLTIAGLKNRAITSHSLRRTFAAQFLREDGDIEALKELLGHASVGTTERYLQ